MAIPIDEQIATFIIWILYFVGFYFSLFWLSVLFLNPEDNTKKLRKVWPSVTIVLPMFNEEKHVEWTMNSVFALDYPKDKLKVIAVNDGSTDNTLKILRTLSKKYNFIIIDKKNGGKYSALNAALEIIDTEFFACLDGDCCIEPNSLKRIIEEFDNNDVAAVMPIMKVYNPKNILQRVQWLEYIISIFYKYIMGKLDCIHVTPGPLSTYRTSVIKKLGGFRRAHLTEDLEMALRLQEHNYKLKQSLSAIVYTNSPSTVKAFISQRTRWYYGTLLNIWDYKHFLFNRKYEDFGMYHMPLVTITGFLSFLGFLTVIYLFLKECYLTVKRWYMTNFDFWTYITNYWNTTLLDLDWQGIFYAGVLFSLVFIIIYLSIIATKETRSILLNFKYFFMVLYYFFIYNLLTGYIWTKVLVKILFRKDNSWTKVN